MTEQALEPPDRRRALRALEDALEKPLVALGFVWLALLVIELVRGLTQVLQTVSTAIWIVFIVDFAARLALAERKLVYLRTNWLTALSLALPALRVFRLARLVRVARGLRATRGLRLVRVITSINRGMRSLRATLGRHHFAYVMGMTGLVTIAGAAGMYAFERDAAAGGKGLSSFGEALWWTAMIMTTMGSEVWPKTPEGRLLCLLLALYAFAIFGYVTAVLATFFVGRERGVEERKRPTLADVQAELRELRRLLERGPPGERPA